MISGKLPPPFSQAAWTNLSQYLAAAIWTMPSKLVVAGDDDSVDFEMAEHLLDAVARLVERPVMLNFDAAV